MPRRVCGFLGLCTQCPSDNNCTSVEAAPGHRDGLLLASGSGDGRRRIASTKQVGLGAAGNIEHHLKCLGVQRSSLSHQVPPEAKTRCIIGVRKRSRRGTSASSLKCVSRSESGCCAVRKLHQRPCSSPMALHVCQLPQVSVSVGKWVLCRAESG